MALQSTKALLLIFLCGYEISCIAMQDQMRANKRLIKAIGDCNLSEIEKTFKDNDDDADDATFYFDRHISYVNLRGTITHNGSPAHDHQTALFVIANRQAYKDNHGKIGPMVELCKKYGVDFNHKDAWNNNALHHLLRITGEDYLGSDSRNLAKKRAINKTAHIAMRALIENGIDINATDRSGFTPAHIIAMRHIIENSGHKITTKNKDFNLLMYKHASIDIPDRRGWTVRKILQEQAQMQEKSDTKYRMTADDKQQLPYYKPIQQENLKRLCQKLSSKHS